MKHWNSGIPLNKSATNLDKSVDLDDRWLQYMPTHRAPVNYCKLLLISSFSETTKSSVNVIRLLLLINFLRYSNLSMLPYDEGVYIGLRQ